MRFSARTGRRLRVLRRTALETEADLPFAGLRLFLRPLLGFLRAVPRTQAGANRTGVQGALTRTSAWPDPSACPAGPSGIVLLKDNSKQGATMSAIIRTFGSDNISPDKPALYCVPPSGAGASLYRSWAKQLGSTFRVRVYQPPGRENRIGEPAHTTVIGAAEELLSACLSDGGDYVLFGHSLGALVAFEAARLAQRSNARRPRALIVSACAPPHRARDLEAERRASQDDAACIDFLRGLGGTPEEVFASSALLEIILPVARGDLAMLVGYRYHEEPQVELPLLILGGRQDSHIREEQLAAWANLTSGPSKLEVLEGGHFYISENPSFFTTMSAAFADGSFWIDQLSAKGPAHQG